MRHIALILVLAGFQGFSQAPKNFFTKFGGIGVDVGYSVKQTLDKQYIVGGSSSTGGNGNTDFYLLRVDSMGKKIWEKLLGGFGNDVARSVIQLPDSGYVLTGYSNSFGNGGYDALTIRTDKAGNQLWLRSFGGEDWDFGYDVTRAADGGIVICGSTYSFGNGKLDGFVVKYDLAGNFQWQKFFGSAEDDDLRAIITTSDNQLATVGCSRKKDVNGDCLFMKLNNSGDTLFTRYFGGPYTDYANDLVQKPDNDYVIGGAITPSLTAKKHSLMYSIKVNGDSYWDNKFFYGPKDEEWVCVTNSLYKPQFTGYIRNDLIENFKQQGTIFYAAPPGYPEKVNSFGGYEDETIYGMDGTKDGGFVSVGVTSSFESVNGDLFFIKQDTTIYNYANEVGVEELEMGATAERFMLGFLGQGHWQLIFPSGISVDKIEILDLYGRVIREKRLQNESKVDIDLSDLSSGLYFVNLTTDGVSLFRDRLINDK